MGTDYSSRAVEKNITIGGSCSPFFNTSEYTLRATDSVTLNAGSEVHIYNAITFPECVDYNSFTKAAHSSENAPYVSNSETNAKVIEADFIKKHQGFSASLFPNPNFGLFNVTIQNNTDIATIISIYSLQGSKITEFVTENSKLTLDISYLPKGMYYVRIQNNKDNINKKLILQ